MITNRNTTLKIKLKSNEKLDEIELFKSIMLKFQKNISGNMAQIILSEPEKQLFDKLNNL